MKGVAGCIGLLLAACATHPGPHPGVPQQSASQSDALDLHFQAVSAGLRADGLRARGLLERGFLPPGGRAAYPIRIAAGECAVFIALGTANVSDLDAAIYTPEGAALIEDDSAGARPSLTLCARERPIDAYLTLHAYQGAGSFIAAEFTRPVRPDDDLQTVTADRAVSPLGELAQTLHERGFEDAAPRVRLTLGDARPVRLAVNVAAGECYTLAAEGGEGLGELSLRLVDAEGGELANGLGELRLAALQYCASARAELALEVSAKRGQGIASVGRFRAAQAVVGGARALWLGEPTPSEAAWASAKQAAAPTPPRPPRRIALRQGAVAELPLTKPGGGCQRWEAELEPGLWRATLRIETEQGALLGEADSDNLRACVVVCAPATAQRVTLIGRAGFGSVLVSSASVRDPDAARAHCAGCTPAEGAACASPSGRR